MTTAPVATAQQEAARILESVLNDLLQSERDVMLLLRKSAHACQLLSWSDAKTWFQNELDGYRLDQEVPWFRKVPAQRQWRPLGLLDLQRVIAKELLGGAQETQYEAYPVRAPAARIVEYAEKGYSVPTGPTETRMVESLEKHVEGHELITIPASSVVGLLNNLENEIFRWASQAYSAVRYGDAVSDVWSTARSNVEQALASLGLDGHLDQIRQGLLSQDPEAWRLAMLACRNLLRDLAACLWRDERETYEHLPGANEPFISVTPDRYVNRLIAYLHQKGAVGTVGDYLRAEWRRLQELHALASKGKGPVSLDEARLTVVSTYLAIAEVAQRTDLQPVTTYTNPQSR